MAPSLSIPLLLTAHTSFLNLLYCTPHYGLFFCCWFFSSNCKVGRVTCFSTFSGRLLCLYDKSLNTANPSSVNGGKGWRGQKTPWMHSYNPKTEESKAGRSLWLQVTLGYLMHPSSTQLHTVKPCLKQKQCSYNSISLLFKWVSEKHNLVVLFGGISSQID